MMWIKFISLLACFCISEAFVKYGTTAKEEDAKHDYMVYLNIDSGHGLQGCGAVLLTNKIVLTACHCVVTPDGHKNSKGTVQLYAYKADIDDSDAGFIYAKRKTFKFQGVETSACYSGNGELSPENDWALVFIKEDVSAALEENDICASKQSPIIPMLPTLYFDGDEDTGSTIGLETFLNDPTKCYFAGFGFRETSSQPAGLKNDLQHIQVEKITKEDPQLPDALKVAFKKTSNGEQSNVCSGDSGGALVCVHKDKLFLVGVLSGGAPKSGRGGPQKRGTPQEDCLNNEPFGMFTSVHRKWGDISQAIEKAGATEEVKKWQKTCSEFFKNFGLTKQNRREEEDLPAEDCFFCSASSISLIATITLIVFLNL